MTTSEPQSFMEAVDALAHRSANSLTKMAERIGKPVNYLRKACSQYDQAHPFRGDLIVPMTIASADEPDRRNDIVIEYLARAVGGVFYRVPSSLGNFNLTPNVLKELGDYLQAVSDGSVDHRYTPGEVARIRREGMQVVQAILADVKAIEQQAQAPAPASAEVVRLEGRR